MTALTAKAALVDAAALGDTGGVIATSVPRSEIEDALATGTTSELFLDVARERDGEREAEQRITVSWEPADLEKLLQTASGDQVTFAFKTDELARVFEEPDVEAQGLREKMAILTVAATTAAGIGAGVAGAMPMYASEGGTQAAFVTDATSSGPQALTEEGTVSNLVTDATSSGPQAIEEEGTVSNLVTDTTSSAGSAYEGLTPAQQLAAIEADAAAEGTVSNLVTDTTSSGPQASTEAGTVSNLVTDATSSGPREVAQTASASGGGGEGFIESTGGQAALAGGLVLLILELGSWLPASGAGSSRRNASHRSRRRERPSRSRRPA